MIWDLFPGFLEVSVAGAWVALALLLVRWALAPWLGARLRFALWALLAARLLLPDLPESPFSVQQTPSILGQAPLPGLDPQWSGAIAELAAAPATISGATWDWQILLTVAWLAGVLVLALRVLSAAAADRRRAREARPIRDERVLAILRQCKETLGGGAAVGLRESAAVDGPVLCGSSQPTILLPEGAADELSDGQLRHILLHELSHVVRRDPLWHGLALGILCLHWFNPLAWMAFRAFRDDLEMACDARSLAGLPPTERRLYGHTLLDLGVREPGALASASFAVGSKKQLVRRLEMIARFETAPRVRVGLLALLVAGLAACTLTEPPTDAAADEEARLEALTATEIAAIFADKLAPSDENPVAVAAELSKIWQANQDQAEEITIAIQKEAELAIARGEGDLAGTLAKMLEVLAAQDGIAPPPASDEVLRTKATVQALRTAGTALHAHFGAIEHPKSEGKMATFDWSECEPVSTNRIRRLADQQGWGPLPAYDGWGHDLEYCLRGDLLDGSPSESPFGYGVRSPGEDGRFEPGPYAIGGFDVENGERDIVWIDGFFATWPASTSSVASTS